MAGQPLDSSTRHTFNAEAIKGRNVVAVIDFRRTVIYLLGGTGEETPQRVEDSDPQGHSHEIAHKAGNPEGTYEAGNADYWQETAKHWRPLARSC